MDPKQSNPKTMQAEQRIRKTSKKYLDINPDTKNFLFFQLSTWRVAHQNQAIPAFPRAEKEGFEDSSHLASPHKINVCWGSDYKSNQKVIKIGKEN